MKKIQRGANIDSTELNRNLSELSTLLAQAYSYNSQLRGRQAILDTALQGALSALSDYDNRITPDLTKYNAVYNSGGAGSDNHMWAGNPPHLLSQLLFNTLPSSDTWYNNTTVLSNHLQLETTKVHSKVPTVPNDFGEQVPSDGTTIYIDGVEDTEWAWTILAAGMMWCTTSSTNTMNVRIVIPPGLSPNVNHIGVQMLFPVKNTYLVKYKDIGGSLHVLKDSVGNSTHSTNQDFYFPNAKFGGEIILELTSSIQDSQGDYIFGLSGVSASEDIFKPSGYMIKQLSMHSIDGDLTARYLHAVYYAGSMQAVPRLSDAIRIQIGSSLITDENGNKNISNIVYDTNVHPLSGISAYGINLSSSTYYAKVTLNSVNKITPTLEGLLFEYSNEV